jgi:hypothetical protein
MLRRSPRLAEKAATVSTPVSETIPFAQTIRTKTKTPRVSKQVVTHRQLTTEELNHDLTLRQLLLVEATAIRRQIGQARTPEDFAACHDRADKLWHQSKELITDGCDKMFITDCCRYCSQAKLGAIEHHYAIDVIKVYINCLKKRILSPDITIVSRVDHP